MRFLVLGLLAILAACTSSPDITTDYDHAVDFSRFHTFAFEPKLATDSAGYSSLTTQRIRAAVQREMTARGYVYDEANPDLLVNFAGKQEDKVQVTQTPVPMGYYGYRAGFYHPWPGYAMDTRVDQYTEGTLNIDLIDRARQQMVWEGVAIGRITQAMKDAPEQTINDTVAQIFAKYPFHPLPRNAVPQNSTQ
jgi:hypothetical protein